MSVLRQVRSPVSRWRKILAITYNELLRLGAGDVWVFGSQAMSLHMKKRALASKDLDLLASGLTMRMIEKLCNILAPLSNGRPPNYLLQNPMREQRRQPFFAISLSPTNERPFIIEIFQTYNGYDLTKLTPYAANVNRWGQEFQTLSIEAIIGTRLAFRPPERISKINADRLNRFIRSTRKQIDWAEVEKFARDFQLEQRIIENLKDVRRRNIKIVDSQRLGFLTES
ncbi:MAG: hypothetical protein PXY39_02300 [archaeon]|nr:hypothetical protein [archaeon]